MNYPMGKSPKKVKVIKSNRSKYKNIKTKYDGKMFDSIKEKYRYMELKTLEEKGKISNLRTQVKYELQPSYEIDGKNIRAINYIADFVYELNGEEIIEDTKGFRTQIYKLKKKMFEYKYKKKIIER